MSLVDKYDTIFFDLFFYLINTREDEENKVHESTLVDIPIKQWTKASEHQVYERSVGELQNPLDIVRNMVHSVKPSVSEQALLSVLETRIERIKSTVINVHPDNIKVLKKLKAKGKRLCLISNVDVVDIVGWEESPLSSLFDEVVFSCVVKAAKPSPEIYKIAMNRMKVAVKDCVFIGDGGSDELKGAKALGIATILTTQYRGKLWPHTIEKLSHYADHTINHLSELL